MLGRIATSSRRFLAWLICAGLLLGSWPAQASQALRQPAGAQLPGAPLLPPPATATPGARGDGSPPLAAAQPAAPPDSPLASLRQTATEASEPEAAADALDAEFDAERSKPAEAAEAVEETETVEAAPAAETAEPLEGARAQLPAGSPLAQSGVEQMAKALFQLRNDVQHDARDILKQEMGGDVGDGRLHRDLKRVMRRLTSAAGLAPEAAQIFVGGSFLPNAFTTITESEGKFLDDNASIAKAFQVSNVFLSLGLLRASQSEEELALVLAHELMHNLKGHLKSFPGTHVLMGHFHEFEADAEALKLVAKAGYDPRKAIDMLYSLHGEMDRLKKKYALLGRDKNDILETLERLQDVHPHPDFRKANMLEHMNEALELYKPTPVPDNPVWKQRRDAVSHPTHLDRLEQRLQKAADKGPVEESLRSLEQTVQREFAKSKPQIEELSLVEQAYRTIAARAKTAQELRYIEVSARRQSIEGRYPTRRLKASLVTRQLDLAVGQNGRPTLEEFEQLAPTLGEEVRRAGALRTLGQIRDRRELDAAYRAISREAENLGFDLARMRKIGGMEEKADKLEADVVKRLWRGARKVLGAELGRPARPEEIVADVRGHIAPAWFQEFYKSFDVEIIETAFGPDAQRSQRYRPSELAALMRGVDVAQLAGKEPKPGETVEGFPDALNAWADRHYRPESAAVSQETGKATFTYERYYVEGLASASLRDQLDLLWRWWPGDKISFAWPPEDPPLPKPFVRVLRKEGKLDAFLAAAFADAARALETDLAGAGHALKSRTAVLKYVMRAEMLLKTGLQDVEELKGVNAVIASCWQPVEKLLESKQVNAAFGDENRSRLADSFFKSMGDALRQAIIRLDTAGQRPPNEDVQASAALAARIDKTLRPKAGRAMVLAHARNLLKRIGHQKDYMRAYHAALPEAVPYYFTWMKLAFSMLAVWALALPALWLWWAPALVLTAVVAAALIYDAVVGWSLWKRWSAGHLPGFSRKESRPLDPRDFVHFLSMLGDDKIPAASKVTAAALLDRLDIDLDGGMLASTTTGRWLLEDAVAQSSSPEDLRRLARLLLRVNDLHPGFLQPDLQSPGSLSNAFRKGAHTVRRNEPMRAILKMQHPFRGINARWALALVEKLDAAKAWPSNLSARLDLLDLLDSNGDFSDVLDSRIVAEARSDPSGFVKWVSSDRERLERFKGPKKQRREWDDIDKVKTPYGAIQLPLAQPLRIVRNPALRAQLFELLPESRVAERQRFSLRGLRQQWRSWKRLIKAYRRARRYFSAAFLRSMRHEGSLEEKFLQVLEEADRYATREAEKTRARWDKGQFTKEELERYFGKDPERWKLLLEHEKADAMRAYKEIKRGEALAAIQELYTAYAETQEPVLGLLLDNYPEPTRSRDELLERVMKARRLSPDRLAFLEGNKSYRQPNPVRMMEKHLLEAALIQMRKFRPAERVRIILDTAGIKKLTKEQERAYNRRILSSDRKKLARKKAALRSVSQLRNYMSLMHAKDRSMLMRAQFHGETSLHKQPRVVRYLFNKVVIDGRDLPPFVQTVLRTYFDVLTPDEKSRLLADLAAFENVNRDLKGPKILRVALKGMGVTGAKIAQVLATHKGLLPPEYAEAFEDFKDKAQDMEKMRAFSVASSRLSALGAETSVPVATPPFATLDAWAKEALPQAGEAFRRALVDQVDFLLKEKAGRVHAVESLGRELGSGSIKVVYKVTLEDGRVWVVKVRAPGASHSIQREFEILEQLVAKLETQGTLKFPGTHQLLDEVRALVKAEMDFRDEAVKEAAMSQRVSARPFWTRLFGAPAPYVPAPHPVYVSEDMMVEEFVPSIRFADLPRWSLFGPSQRRVSALSVREGMFALVYEGWLEPDPHTGNRHARSGWLYRLWTKLVLMDLGQGQSVPIDRLKPLMRAALAVEAKDTAGAARALAEIMNFPVNKPAQEVLDAMTKGLTGGDGVIERLMNALLEGEKKEALVKPEYASIQKAFILYTGYSPYLPKDFLYHALERAAMARLVAKRPVPLWRLAWLGLRRLVLGRAATRAELQGLINQL